MRILLIICCLLPMLSVGQVTLVKAITVDSAVANVSVDARHQVYGMLGAKLIRFNEDGSVKYIYSDRQFGEIVSYDLTNHLHPMLFFRDVASLVFLDNTLAEKHHLRLEDFVLEQVLMACASSNNGFWLYDNEMYTVKRFDPSAKKIAESINLLQMLELEVSPKKMVEANQMLYLLDESGAIYCFDVFGTYVKTLPLGAVDFWVTEAAIFFVKENQLYAYQEKYKEVIKVSVNDVPTGELRWKANHCERIVGGMKEIYYFDFR